MRAATNSAPDRKNMPAHGKRLPGIGFWHFPRKMISSTALEALPDIPTRRSDDFDLPNIPTRAHNPPDGAGWVHEISTTAAAYRCAGSVTRCGYSLGAVTRPRSGSALLKGECPHKNAEYGRNCVNREIDPARMPSRDIKLHNVNHCAKDHRPNAQNPLAPCIRQTKQEAGDQECRGVLDIMGRVSRGPKVRRHHREHHNGRQRRPRRHQIKLPRHYRRLWRPSGQNDADHERRDGR